MDDRVRLYSDRPACGSLASFQLPKWGGDNLHVLWTDDNDALVCYVRTGGGSFDHRSFALTTLATTLWTKRNGKWLAIHHQETDLLQYRRPTRETPG